MNMEMARERAATRRPARLGLTARAGRRLCLVALARLRSGTVELIDGSERHVGGGREPGPRVTVRVLDPRFYSALALGGSVGVGEAYMDGLWECDDIAGLMEVMVLNDGADEGVEGPMSRAAGAARRAASLLQRNSRAGSRRNIRAHYDLSNEFFGAFLDESMTYSSAVFAAPGETLERAQFEKLDRACRRLALRPTDHLLEIGTGWGSMAIHAAREYGCRVTTTTISREQHDLAVRRIDEAGLADRVRVEMTDYRDLSAPAGGYDKLVSIEMVEAVGAERLDGYFRACGRLLRPEGAMLLQAIVIRDQHYEGARRRVDFLKKHIFPGSCLLSVSAISSSVARASDMGVSHLEEFGLDYAATLREWRARFWGNIERVRAMGFDERFIRMWHFYLSYCEGVFRSRRTGVVQVLLTGPRWGLGERA